MLKDRFCQQGELSINYLESDNCRLISLFIGLCIACFSVLTVIYMISRFSTIVVIMVMIIMSGAAMRILYHKTCKPVQTMAGHDMSRPCGPGHLCKQKL